MNGGGCECQYRRRGWVEINRGSGPWTRAGGVPAEMIHYGMSKTALLAVSRGFAKEAAGSGVTVNSVTAGPTRTEGVEDFVYELVDRDLPWEDAQRVFMRARVHSGRERCAPVRSGSLLPRPRRPRHNDFSNGARSPSALGRALFTTAHGSSRVNVPSPFSSKLALATAWPAAVTPKLVYA